jgi:hypothetical protein
MLTAALEERPQNARQADALEQRLPELDVSTYFELLGRQAAEWRRVQKDLEAIERAKTTALEYTERLYRSKLRAKPRGVRTERAAAYAFDALSMLVPKRISNEEIGDAMEQVQAMVLARRPRWFIYMKIVTTFFWVFVHTLLHYAAQVAGIIGKATGGKGD